MIHLSDGTIVREISVQGGEGKFAYFIHFTAPNGLPEVGLESELRIHDSRLAGVHFNVKGHDYVIIRGSIFGPTDRQLEEVLHYLEPDCV